MYEGKLMKKTNISNIVLCGLSAALIILLTMVTIPMPSGVPITLQTFGVALCGYLLGAKNGTVSTGVYVALGAVGLPVFAGFGGGLGKLFGVTGGFIWGFIIMAFLCGVGSIKNRKITMTAFGLLGLAICHIIGIVQFSVISGNGFIPSALLVSVPYIIKDIISVIMALIISILLKKTLKKAKLI